jgi:hypothetical protein
MDAHLTKAFSDLTGLIARLAGPAADELGQMGGDTAREYRVRNAIKIFHRIEKMLTEAGITPEPISPRLFLPAIEAATVEDNESLQDLWAALMANAANPARRDAVLPSFVEILKQLLPEEATAIANLRDYTWGIHGEHPQPWMGMTDRGIFLGGFDNIQRFIPGTEESDSRTTDRHKIMLVDDLVRLGILDRLPLYLPQGEDWPSTWPTRPGAAMYVFTPYAEAFFTACIKP